MIYGQLHFSVCHVGYTKSNMSKDASKGGEAWFVGGGIKRRRKWPWLLALVVVAALLALWFLVPAARNGAASILGLKAEIRIVASEEGYTTDVEGNPLVSLKRFNANVNGNQLFSDGDAVIVVSDARFGDNEVSVQKEGYNSVSGTTVVSADPFLGFLGKPKPQDFIAPLVPQAEKTVLNVQDWVSGQPLIRGEFITGDRTARPNQDGEVSLLLPADEQSFNVEARFDRDYLDKTYTLNTAENNHVARVVSDGFVYSVNKKNYDIRRSYVDGSDERVFIKATKQETPALQFAVSPTGNFAVMSSTREGGKLQKLYAVDLSNADLTEIDQGKDFVLYDWSKNNLVYSHSYQTDAGARQRLRSVEVGTRNQYELGSVKGTITQVHVVDNTVLYMARQSDDKNKLVSVGIKGASERSLGTGVKSLRQTSYQSFMYQTDKNTWNALNIATNQVTAATAPSAPGNLFFASPTPQNERLVVSLEDNKKTLSRVSGTNESTRLAGGAELGGQVRFINATTVLYRQGESLFAVSVFGGEPKKIAENNDTKYPSPPFFAFY
jgi:hypothetical protein